MTIPFSINHKHIEKGFAKVRSFFTLVAIIDKVQAVSLKVK